MRGKNKLRDLLSRPDRGVGATSGITGVLAGLFRKMLQDLNINGMKWSHLMDEYVQIESENNNTNNRRDRASIRGNLNKEFTCGKMTWKVFCRSMMLLKIRRFGIIIVAEHENGKKTAHSTIVDMSVANTTLEDDESLREVVNDIKLGNVLKYQKTEGNV